MQSSDIETLKQMNLIRREFQNTMIEEQCKLSKLLPDEGDYIDSADSAFINKMADSYSLSQQLEVFADKALYDDKSKFTYDSSHKVHKDAMFFMMIERLYNMKERSQSYPIKIKYDDVKYNVTNTSHLGNIMDCYCMSCSDVISPNQIKKSNQYVPLFFP